MDYEEETGTHESDPVINERIREIFGLEATVSHNNSQKYFDIPFNVRKQKALLIVNLDSTYLFYRDLEGHAGRKKEYVSKKELIVRLRNLRELGYKVEVGYKMTSQQMYAYFNNIRRGIETGCILPRAS